MGERFTPYEERTEAEKAFHDSKTNSEENLGDRVEDVDVAHDRATLSNDQRDLAKKAETAMAKHNEEAIKAEEGELDESKIIEKFKSLVINSDSIPSWALDSVAKRFLTFYKREVAKQVVEDIDSITIRRSDSGGKETWYVNYKEAGHPGGYEIFPEEK